MDLDSIDRTSMACPALPTCGLAVTESERSLPDINLRIRALMTKLGFDEGESFVVRMTGQAVTTFTLLGSQGTPWCDGHVVAMGWPHRLVPTGRPCIT